MLNVILLGITSLLTDISSEMIYPLLPLYLTVQLGATPAIVGIIEGFAESLASLLKVFSGKLSDMMRKRKPLAIAGYSFSSFGKLLLYISTSWGYVFIARLVDRFGKGIRTAPRDALIADSSKPTERGKAYGLHRMMDTLGATIGVILSYYFIMTIAKTASSNVYRTIFIYSLIPAVLGVVILFFVKEKLSKNDNLYESHSGVTVKPFIPKKLKIFLIISFIFTMGNSSNQFLLLRARHLGSTIGNVILLYLIYNLSTALFSYPAGKISDKIGRKNIIIVGYIIYGLVYCGFAVIGNTGFLWFLFASYGIYSGLTEGVQKAFISDIAPQENRATLLGLHSTVVGIGLLPASIIAGLLWNILGAPVPFYFGAITAFISSIAFLILI